MSSAMVNAAGTMFGMSEKGNYGSFMRTGRSRRTVRMLVCVYNRRHTDNRGIRKEGAIPVGKRPFFCPWGQRAFN